MSIYCNNNNNNSNSNNKYILGSAVYSTPGSTSVSKWQHKKKLLFISQRILWQLLSFLNGGFG